MYRDGRGVAKDEVMAAAWLRKAAEKGLPVAQVSLALMYWKGPYIAQDEAEAAEAAKWFLAAAEQGVPVAEGVISYMYLNFHSY